MGRLESADLGALKSDAQPSLDSAQRESVLGHYHTESFTRLAHPDCPSNSRRDQGAMLFTKRWTNRRRDASAHRACFVVVCHPQAWSAASIFMIVQAMLGIEIIGFDRKLCIESPAMPSWLDWLKIENLKVGDGAVSFLLRRTPEVPAIGILENIGRVTIELR
jgi:glycogen debranching enzyme